MNSASLDALHAAETWLREGRVVCLATVIETWGSAPRRAGSHMVIDGEGGFAGSVSGGCVEGSVILEAADTIEAGAVRILAFDVADETAWKVGLSCGGRIRILLEPLAALVPAWLEQLNADRAVRRLSMVVTRLDTGHAALVHAGELGTLSGFADILEGCLHTGACACVLLAEHEYFVRPHLPAARVIIIGAVHIAQFLVTMLAQLEFEAIVVDPRPVFATPERFAGSVLVTEWPARALAEIGIDGSTACIALTHDPKLDDDALRFALNSACFYIGALGGRRSHDKRLARLRAAGMDDARLNRIHAPIGLPLGAVTPAEIAMSIAAEIVSIWRQRLPAFRSQTWPGQNQPSHGT